MREGTSDDARVSDPESGLPPPKEVVLAEVAHAVARGADLTHLVGVVCQVGRTGKGGKGILGGGGRLKAKRIGINQHNR